MNHKEIYLALRTFEGLMQRLGMHVLDRGKLVFTTYQDANEPCTPDQVNRYFKADPLNLLLVLDSTYASKFPGCQYLDFVIDFYGGCFVGFHHSRSDPALHELKRAFYGSQPEQTDSLIFHGDRYSQFVSILYSEQLSETWIAPSTGSRGNNYVNALSAETNDLNQPSIIH